MVSVLIAHRPGLATDGCGFHADDFTSVGDGVQVVMITAVLIAQLLTIMRLSCKCLYIGSLNHLLGLQI